MIYLIKQECRRGTMFKVGYCGNLAKRLPQYITHNANVQVVDTIQTYRKTKHRLETEIHSEIKEKGFDFVVNYGIKSEWFFVPIEQEQEFERLGLSQFKACKNRVIKRES